MIICIVRICRRMQKHSSDIDDDDNSDEDNEKLNKDEVCGKDEEAEDHRDEHDGQ